MDLQSFLKKLWWKGFGTWGVGCFFFRTFTTLIDVFWGEIVAFLFFPWLFPVSFFSDVLCWPGSSMIKVIGLLGLFPEQRRWTLYLRTLLFFCHLTIILVWVPLMFKQHNGWERDFATAVVKPRCVKMGQSMEVGVAVVYIWRSGIHAPIFTSISITLLMIGYSRSIHFTD